MKKLLLCVIIIAACGTAHAAEKLKDFTGRVITVAQADVLIVLSPSGTRKVLLSGIDCPERRHPFGRAAWRFTEKTCLQRTVTVKVMAAENDEEMIPAEIILPNGENLGHLLVKEGLGWWNKKEAPDSKELKELELEAMRAGLGVWGDPRLNRPWSTEGTAVGF